MIVSSQSVAGSLPQVLKLIRGAGQLSSPKWQEILARIGFHLSANSLGEISAELGWGQGDAAVLPTLDQLAEEFPRQQWASPVIVAVDESQRLAGDDTTPHAQFLQSIHDASCGLPLTLVLAGLSDTKDTAICLGLTRGLTTQNIHCLSRTECTELMEEFCQKFAVDIDGCETFLHDLAKPTEGWPRHLHFTFKALVKGVLRTKGKVSDINWDHVHTVSAQGRVSYYQPQQSAVLRALKPLVGEVMLDMKIGGSFKTLTNRIRRAVTPDMLDDLPEDLQDMQSFPRRLAAEMIHQGAIQEFEPDRFFSPIPSFRTYLIKEGIMDPTSTLPPYRPFKLYYGTTPIAKAGDCPSYTAARSWALEKMRQMGTAENVSLWYADINLETLRHGTLPPSTPP